MLFYCLCENMIVIISALFYNNISLLQESDYEDDSTLTGGSQNTDSPNCNFVEDDTLTGCGMYKFIFNYILSFSF